MMTWLTRISWFDTAEDLDDNLLLLCVKEASELLHAMLLADPDEEAAGHPLWRMWAGSEAALAAYAAVCTVEATRRGYTLGKTHTLIDNTMMIVRRSEPLDFVEPLWKDDTDMLRSHRSNLVRRWPRLYGTRWRGTPEQMPYLWAFPDEKGGYGLFVSKYDRELLASGERVLPAAIKKRVENL